MGMVALRVRTPVADEELSALFVAGWPGHRNTGFARVHERSLTWISAWRGERLAGYVNVATDGGIHAFVLDTTVHPDERRHGLGQRLVRAAEDEARAAGGSSGCTSITSRTWPGFTAVAVSRRPLLACCRWADWAIELARSAVTADCR